jgi:hypothetical protein
MAEDTRRRRIRSAMSGNLAPRAVSLKGDYRFFAAGLKMLFPPTYVVEAL